jgi:hypothetical protein
MLTRCADGNISVEATTQSGNIFPEATRPPEPGQYSMSIHSADRRIAAPETIMGDRTGVARAVAPEAFKEREQ